MAGPTTKPLSVPVLAGMRQDVSEHLAPMGTLSYASNCRFRVGGEVQSRVGTFALSANTDCNIPYTTVADAAGPTVLARVPGGFYVGAEGYGFRYTADEERLHIAGSYSNAEPRGIWETMAREEQTLASGKCAPWPLSQAAVRGYVATVYSDGNGQPIGDGTYDVGPGLRQNITLHVRAEDGTLVMSATLASATAAWLVADGSSSTTIILVYQNTTTGINARVITTSATGATLGSAVALTTLTAATAHWAACEWPGLGWALLRETPPGTAVLSLFTGTTLSNIVTFAVTGSPAFSVYADATNVYAGWVEGVGPYASSARVYNTSLVLTSGVAAVSLATEASLQALGPPLFGPSTTTGAAMYALSRSVDERITDDTWMDWGELTSAGSQAIAQRTYQCTAASAPFANGYVWARIGSNLNSHGARYSRYALLDFMGMRATTGTSNSRQSQPVVALVGPAFAAGQENNGYPGGFYLQQLSTPAALSDDVYVMGLPRLVRLAQLSGSDSGLAVAEWLKFTLGGTRQTAPLGEKTVVSGSPVLTDAVVGTREYDGGGGNFALQRAGVDLGFPVWPGIETPVVSNGSGALDNNGVYQWRAVLERIDANGVRWRSGPSAIASETLGAADDTAALTAYASVQYLRALGGAESVEPGSRFVMHFYRTTNGGSTFYRCTPPQGAPCSATGGVFTYTDGASDSDIESGEILYTDGGVLANDFPPSCRFVCATEDRVWLGGLWESEQIQSSKILVPGEPPQFSDSPAFRVVLPAPCTGIAIQDGTVIAFTQHAIYAVLGQGPSDQGQGAWDSPRCVTRSTGGRPLLETSAGIFFESDRGIELLPRGMGDPVFIGAGIRDEFDRTVETVSSAAVVVSGESRTARFCIGTRFVAVFDLDAGAWSIDEYPFSINAIVDTDRGAVLANEDVTAAGYGFLQESRVYDTDAVGDDDEESEIATVLTWCSVAPFGIAGWGRFNDATAMFDSQATGYREVDCTLFAHVDTPTTPDPGFTFAMSPGLSSPGFRQHLQAQVNGTAAKLRIDFEGAGWRCMGWTLCVDDSHGGSRRVAEEEKG